MKQGSHIMLQRLVRSTVSTEPRPWRTVLEPWRCRPSSLCAGMSRPGKFFSIHSRNLESTAIKSSYLPWMGHSFTIQTCPSRSMIWALISPTFSWTRSVQSFLPFMMASRASFTQSGHSESVVRGQPSVGFDFSQDFRRGLSDHFGVKDGLGLCLLKNWMVLNVTPAVLQSAQSNVFQSLLFSLLFAVVGILPFL